MKKHYKRLVTGFILSSVLLVSIVFFTSFTPQPVSKLPVAGELPEGDSLLSPTTSEPSTPTPLPVTTPETGERLEIDHPLPPEPVAVVTPMASAHFGMWEYACDCAGYCNGFPEAMDPLLLEKVEALRCALDAPIIITSGVRCPERNEEVGGISGSWHLWGHAADLYSPEVPYTQVAAVARSLGLGVIEYPGQRFDHVEIWN